jgi:poly(3-hydroxybutyrate) depolymerase
MYFNAHIDDLQSSNAKCKNSGYDGEVIYSVTVGDLKRCFIVYTPPSLKGSPETSIPLLLYAHQSGSFLAECGGTALKDGSGATWHEVADKFGFAFLCIEARQFYTHNEITGAYMSGGIWDIPTKYNSRTGNNCDADDSVEHE